MGELTHLDDEGQARMVDVGSKPETQRLAVASAVVRTRPEVIAAIRQGSAAKGDVLAVARVAGILAAKKTSALIPLCHPLRLDTVKVDLALGRAAVRLRAEARCTGPTGVEMEALTAAAVAALTVYDMCKAMDRTMRITDLCLEEKSGGRSGHFRREAREAPEAPKTPKAPKASVAPGAPVPPVAPVAPVRAGRATRARPTQGARRAPRATGRGERERNTDAGKARR